MGRDRCEHIAHSSHAPGPNLVSGVMVLSRPVVPRPVIECGAEASARGMYDTDCWFSVVARSLWDPAYVGGKSLVGPFEDREG